VGVQGCKGLLGMDKADVGDQPASVFVINEVRTAERLAPLGQILAPAPSRVRPTAGLSSNRTLSSYG
jgi:hypothetical protein